MRKNVLCVLLLIALVPCMVTCTEITTRGVFMDTKKKKFDRASKREAIRVVKEETIDVRLRIQIHQKKTEETTITKENLIKIQQFILQCCFPN